mmetsp:Transcript_63232/g.181859  ORF Transcript_63232/g.181859 Transcript_63232/m.181859 type:complete len:392 (+) Transcript_63232:85-1260(+)
MGSAGLQGISDPAEDGAMLRLIAAAAADAARDSFHGDYALARRLGRGAFGAVYGATRRVAGRQRSDVAVKVLSSNPAGRSSRGRRLDSKKKHLALHEAAVLRALPASDNIVQFHGVYAEGPFTYIVMELCATGLLSYLQMSTPTEETMREVFKDMAGGIAVCHAANIAHRDVKPDNFLVALGPQGAPAGAKVKLCDFGLARVVSSPEAKELAGVVGTPPFMSPEMLSGEDYSAKVDVWALGALAYALLFGSWPYASSEDSGAAMKAAIASGAQAPSFQCRAGLPDLSPPCREWVRALLDRDEDARPSAKAALAHPALSTPWASSATEVSLSRCISEALRLGAFDLGDTYEKTTEMDRMLQAMNTDHRLRGLRKHKHMSISRSMRRATLMCI